MTITILPPAKTQFSDSNGNPLAGGSVFMYVPNSTTFKTSWQDSGGTIPNANPIILDAAGECLLWGSGQYRQLVQDSLGNTIFDAITEDPGFAVAASFGGTSTTSVAVGTGSKTFTTQTGLQFFPGATVNISSNASALNYMNGTIASYNTTSGVLVVTVLTDGGSGTYADWNIAVSGIQGPAGTVTAISIASTNGFAGSSSGGGTPQLTLSTSVTGIVKGDGTTLSAATAGTDYSAGTSGNSTGIVKSTTGTGALTTAVAADFPVLNQNTTGQANTVVTNANLTGPVTSVGNATTITNSSVTEAMLNLSNNTTANVTTSQHGLAPVLPNDITKFLNGVGTYTAPVVSSTIGTSTTSLAIATGSTTFTTQAGLTLGTGQFVIIPSAASSANFFFGQVTSYSGTTLIVNVTVTGGSGTHADWSILDSGPQGPAGSGSINVGTANQLAYYAGSGSTVSGLATANSGILVTGSGGVPSIGTAIPNGVTATTQTAADATTKIATTAFVNGTALTLTSGTTATTQSPLDDSTQVATTAYTDAAVAAKATGAMVLLSSQTISSSTSTVSVTSGINSTYSHYIWEISNLTSITASVDGYITVQQGGSFVGGSSYYSQGVRCSGSIVAATDNGAAHFTATGGGGAIEQSTPSIIRFEFWNPSVVNFLAVIFESLQNDGSSQVEYLRAGGTVITSAATTGVQLTLSSGNIATCTANLYGIT